MAWRCRGRAWPSTRRSQRCVAAAARAAILLSLLAGNASARHLQQAAPAVAPPQATPIVRATLAPAPQPGDHGFVAFEQLILRLSGDGLVPWALPDQLAFVQAGNELIASTFGPLALLSYSEGQPHGRRGGVTEAKPFVDVLVRAYSISYNTTAQSSSSAASRLYISFLSAVSRYNQLVAKPVNVRVLSLDPSGFQPDGFALPPYPLSPLAPRVAQLALSGPGAACLSASAGGGAAASLVLGALQRALVGRAATWVEVDGVVPAGGGGTGTAAINATLMLLECVPPGSPAAASAPQSYNDSALYDSSSAGDNPEVVALPAEAAAAAAALQADAPQGVLCGAAARAEVARVVASAAFQQLVKAAGLDVSVTLSGLASRAPLPVPAVVAPAPAQVLQLAAAVTTQSAAAPAPLGRIGFQLGGTNGSVRAASSSPFGAGEVPWSLDRIDQRDLPLDGKFIANASGTGVNIYLLSSGVLASHQEFGYADGRPGTRVRSAWGYMGLDPLKDCDDYGVWYSYGTYAASLMAGRTLGVAKNATIWSVRFRQYCLFESVDIWAPGGLPSAMDAVISTHIKPAIMVIDTWWDPQRFGTLVDAAYVSSAIRQRLKAAADAGITVITGAGVSIGEPACNDIFASTPTTITVGGSDTFDRRTPAVPVDPPGSNETCIDLWAPGGGLGQDIVGASAQGNDTYTAVIPRAWGASWIAAGVAAQYLAAHPTASPAEVKAALVALSTAGVLTNVGSSPNRVLFTNLTDLAAVTPPAGGSSGAAATAGGAPSGLVAAAGTSSPSAGAWIGIGVSAAAAAALAAAAAMFVIVRRRGAARKAAARLVPTDGFGRWQLGDKQVIEVCKRPDGTDWELGVGSFGRVYKAIKGGVQEVAVKTVLGTDDSQATAFEHEVQMMQFVSRDRNIVQFYGACVQPGRLMLVTEYMEGGDLRRALNNDQQGTLRWGAAGKSVALDVARGLAFLHAHNVIHRDLKSKNILLTKEGLAKIADVGMAKMLTDGYLTRDHAMGTFAWAAPEVLLGDRCTEKVDIYSFGVVLWELVTHEVPVRGHLRAPAMPAECPAEVSDLIDACWQLNAAARPSARELYERLQACPPVHPDQPGGDGAGKLDGELPDKLAGTLYGNDSAATLSLEQLHNTETGRWLVRASPPVSAPVAAAARLGWVADEPIGDSDGSARGARAPSVAATMMQWHLEPQVAAAPPRFSFVNAFQQHAGQPAPASQPQHASAAAGEATVHAQAGAPAALPSEEPGGLGWGARPGAAPVALHAEGQQQAMQDGEAHQAGSAGGSGSHTSTGGGDSEGRRRGSLRRLLSKVLYWST